MFKRKIFYLILIIVVSVSCINSETENKLPDPPLKPSKYIVKYKGVDYPFNSEAEMRSFIDSTGLSIDTSKHIL